MKNLKIVSFVLVLLFALSSGVAAQDFPCAPCPMDAECTLPPCGGGGGVFTNPDWLKIDYHRVNVEIENQIAHTSIDMKFVNEGEGTGQLESFEVAMGDLGLTNLLMLTHLVSFTLASDLVGEQLDGNVVFNDFHLDADLLISAMSSPTTA